MEGITSRGAAEATRGGALPTTQPHGCAEPIVSTTRPGTKRSVAEAAGAGGWSGAEGRVGIVFGDVSRPVGKTGRPGTRPKDGRAHGKRIARSRESQALSMASANDRPS